MRGNDGGDIVVGSVGASDGRGEGADDGPALTECWEIET